MTIRSTAITQDDTDFHGEEPMTLRAALPATVTPTSAAIAIAPATDVPQMVIRLRRAPDREPPFDDELPSPRLRIVGPWDQQLPFEEAAAEAAQRDAAPSAPIPMQRPAVSAFPDPDQWGRRFLIALLESAAGRRPMSQLGRHTSMAVLNGFRADAGASARLAPGRRPGTVRTVRCSQPSERVAEFSAVIQVGPRYRAIAARFEQHADSWRCVRLQIG
jgi:hypothetical protein